MPKKLLKNPTDANNVGVYNEQINPNIAGLPSRLLAVGQNPYEGFELAYGYGGESAQVEQMGERMLPNDAPQNFVTDNYKPSDPAPGRGKGGS